ncbi:MAG: hypothetical protein IVW36_05935 [Dehalococcoidia bacterium]|nr:hypothetical protein [Dehalococcoidia bacterium]
MRRRRWHAAVAFVLLAGAGVLAASCGGSTSGAVSFPTVLTLGGRDIYPNIESTSLAVGPNRFLVGLTDNASNIISDAQMSLRFYDLTGPKPVFSAAATTELVKTDLTLEVPGGGKKPAGTDAVYVAQDVRFNKPGQWGVQIDLTRNGKKLKPIPYTFNVLERTPEPAIGAPAPASVQQVLSDVGGDAARIDSSDPPRPQMHGVTVADALKTGKPIVLAFATPGYCASRTCGPMMENVMDPLYARYKDQAIFIQIEPYDLKTLFDTGKQVPVPAFRQWNLQSEPWIFVIDRQGKVAGKFEGIATAGEVEAVLTRALGRGAPSGTATSG